MLTVGVSEGGDGGEGVGADVGGSVSDVGGQGVVHRLQGRNVVAELCRLAGGSGQRGVGRGCKEASLLSKRGI